MSLRERLFRLARAELSAAQRRLFRRSAVHDYEPLEADEPSPPRTRSAPQTDPLADAYRHLELPAGASAAEAKQAYRRLMKRYHPDLFRTEEEKAAASRLSRGLRDAYERIEAWEGTRNRR